MHRDAPGSSSGALVALCLVQFVDMLGVTEMITAMPRILDALAEPASAASLLLTAYAMRFGGLLMLGSRVGDRFGHRRTLLAGIAGFAAGSLACAVAALGHVVGDRALRPVSVGGESVVGLRLRPRAPRSARAGGRGPLERAARWLRGRYLSARVPSADAAVLAERRSASVGAAAARSGRPDRDAAADLPGPRCSPRR